MAGLSTRAMSSTPSSASAAFVITVEHLRKAIPRILTQMKADGVRPHTSAYNTLLKVEASEHNIDDVGKFFSEMRMAGVEPNEITYGILAIAHATARLYTAAEIYTEEIEKSRTVDNWSTYDILLTLYGYLGKKEELRRTWDLVLDLPHVPYKSFKLAIEAFGRIGAVCEAEEIWITMKSNIRLEITEHFNPIISVYCRHGLVDKATKVLNLMLESSCKPNGITYHHMALGYLRSGRVEEALKVIDKLENETVVDKVKRSTPWSETTLMLLEIFAELGDLENSKRLFYELSKTKYSRYTFVHNTFLRAFIRAQVHEPDLLEKMIMGGARPDAETYSLLRIIEHFKIC